MSSGYERIDSNAVPNYGNERTFKNVSISNDIPLQNLPNRGVRRVASPTANTHSFVKSRSCANGKFSRLWIWEILASAFSMICIAIIVIVLIYENGKPLSRWALLIPPNAVISFIAALAKASCVLVLAEIIGQLRWMHLANRPLKLSDLQVRYIHLTSRNWRMHSYCCVQVYGDASRGPYGAFKLVLRSRPGAFMASCASVLMIAALFIDPFSQLVLTFPSRAVSAPEQSASIRVAKAFDAHSTLFANHAGGIAVGTVSETILIKRYMLT